MSAFERIFGTEPVVYDLLEKSAQAADDSVTTLLRLLPDLNGKTGGERIGELAAVRREHKKIRERITDELWKTLSTRLELEDIEALSSALYKITKNVEKVAERLAIAPEGTNCAKLDTPVKLLAQGTTLDVEMVRQFQHGRRCDRVKEAYARLQEIEDQADKAIHLLLRGIYDARPEAREVVYWNDLFELLEKSIERCREAGNGAFTFALKHF
jgi:uncharacterized protein Yka (UPF0111/DUF47 family)